MLPPLAGGSGVFPTTSVHNLLLIATQRPTATRVPGFYAWQQLGRFVKMGEHGLMILAPVPYKAAEESSDDGPVRVGFRVVCVFHVAQTEGAPLPDWVLHSLDGETSAGTRLRAALLQLAADQGLTVNLETTPSTAASGFYGYYPRGTQRIHITSDTRPDQGVDTLWRGTSLRTPPL